MTPATDVPDDPVTLKAMLLAAQGEIAQLNTVNVDTEARIERLTALLTALKRTRFGRRAEALDPGQQAFAFEEIETGLAAIGASLEVTKPAGPRAHCVSGRRFRCPAADRDAS